MVSTRSRPLSQDYGSGFSEKNLRRMIQFASIFPDEAMVATLSRPLSWSHFRELLLLEKPLQRDFYQRRCEGMDKSGSRHAAHLRPWLASSTINSNTLSHFTLNKARS